MFKELIFDRSSAQYNNKILIIDVLNYEAKSHYSDLFKENGFEVIYYSDDLTFRIEYEDKIKKYFDKFVIISQNNKYIPYDIYQLCFVFELTPESIFSKLNFQLVKDASLFELDLLSLAYTNLFEHINSYDKSKTFLRVKGYAKSNILEYLEKQYAKVKILMQRNQIDYATWMQIAEIKAEIDVISSTYELEFNTNKINEQFKYYILNEFGTLSQSLNYNTPVLVSKALEFISDTSSKFILIVMDGMSEFDWNILSRSFQKMQYTKTSIYAMIPTTTSISRQCLLSNKYPSQLISPWTQSKEKQEFFDCMCELGFSKNQIGYGRGYDIDFDSQIDCGTIIINDIDDLVHSQQHGKFGMYRDVEYLSRKQKLAEVVRKYLRFGYDVYITADHGNAPAVGMGKLLGTGVEVETKSKKMLVLKDFADKQSLIEKYGMIDYPKYYLDNKNDNVVTHGGISIDEVIVPFITFKKEQNNG